MMIVF